MDKDVKKGDKKQITRSHIRMKSFLLVAVMLLATFMMMPFDVSGLSLNTAPLVYDDAVLAKGEVKKGFIDVSNPETTPQKVQLQVKAFRQIDDQGSLEFYTDERVSSGVKLDYNTVTLDPRGAMRIYFLLDGTKLPSGDVFAAILASTVPEFSGAAAQSVAVGTLLIIQNGTPGSRTADIAEFRTNFLQVGEGLSAQMKVRNTAGANQATGFFPSIVVATQPYGTTTVKGPLVFAGRERSVEYRQTGNYFGPIYLKASTGSSEKSQLVFAVTGYWRWLVPIIVIVFVGALWLFRRLKLRRSKKR